MKKIILYISSMKPAGGIERVVSTLANELCNDYEITLLVKDNGESFYYLDKRIEVLSLNCALDLNMRSRFSRGLGLLRNLFVSAYKLRALFYRCNFDYIYVTTPVSFWECFLTGRCNNKIIASEHGARVNYNIIYRALKVGYKFSHSYMIPTKTDFDYYMNSGYPAVYIPHLRPALPYSISKNDVKKVINVGRFTADKQQLALIRMWSELIKEKDHIDEWELILVGTGELEYEIISLVEELDLSNSVKLVPPRKDIETIYSDASIFVLTSSSEGFGMVVLEALSFGLPVVSFDCPSGPRDIIDDNLDGLLVDLNDFEGFKIKLYSLMCDKSLREKMSLHGFSKASVWNQSNILSKFKGLF
ncbi:glycosyltransferase family 4 protein [Shewanella psychromarinicola]|uniref:Glycosyltransferase family 4 protein n=1 Tax=Shewanella psychromarinicola TaxID=2487742 RepID=A0A3N4E6Z6_9GAMM|nr:glycosyltransferase family 4 protein [Shewanella psychromarinicola]AZG35359.1 glycosyltransferase family 4 protein [Shewanella psychromarinicola]MCL1083607.1 glycosyltransferase family 4 protein [Shewanella psychromarinicola]RPA32836.1 glycosyltransferase family 4 protein [Shewanella psychromarinicola]